MMLIRTDYNISVAKCIFPYAFLGFAFLSASCSQDDVNVDTDGSGADWIEFRVSLSDITSRATELNNSSFDSFQVSSFTVGASFLTPYFLEKSFTGSPSGTFVSSDPACIWPNNNDLLRFEAFSPSCAAMRQAGAFGDTYFNLTADEDLSSQGYNLSGFRIPDDISSHFDFVTAIGSGRLRDNIDSCVDLDFHHQLSRIELKAWGASPTYIIEIAGAGLGGVGVGGEFNFPDSSEATGGNNWATLTKGNVEYIFRAGDKIVKIDNGARLHGSANDAAYLLRARIADDGATGVRDNSAMIIPTDNIPWRYKDNPENVDDDGNAEGTYFSVLMRITNVNSDAGKPVYPYPTIPEGMRVIYLAVDDENTVKARLYKQGNEYFTDSAFTSKYDLEANKAEAKAFCWAAVPVGDIWKPGYVYTYTLNYTDGMGLIDPEDPNPGYPVISDMVEIHVDMNEWVRDPENENNVTVPRK